MCQVNRRYQLAIVFLAFFFYAIFIIKSCFHFNNTLYCSLFDDAMISMRYAQNFAQGHGLLWNPGKPPVEGYTNFLWTMWMALLHLLAIPESKTALAVALTGVLVLICNIFVVKAIAARVADSKFVVLSSMVWVAFYYPLVYWTLRGMEVGLLSLLGNCAILMSLKIREQFRIARVLTAAIILSSCILIRYDATIMHVIIAGFIVFWVPPKLRRLTALILLASLLLPIIAHCSFRLYYYQEWLPNTYYLKMTGVSAFSRITRGLFEYSRLAVNHLLPIFASIFFAVIFGKIRRKILDSRLLLLIAIFLGQSAYSIYVGGDAWEWINYSNRYISIAMPTLLILAAAIVQTLESSMPTKRLSSMLLIVSLPINIALVVFFVRSARAQYHSDYNTAFATIAAIGCLYSLLLIANAPTLANYIGDKFPKLATVIIMWLLVNGDSTAKWMDSNGVHVADDIQVAKIGLSLRARTKEQTVIAVTWSGAIPYYSHRQTIDLLGKNDKFIAKTKPAATHFHPGHNKWNYSYSIEQRQPDIITFFSGDARYLYKLGYIKMLHLLSPQQAIMLYVHQNSQHLLNSRFFLQVAE